jgi:hypothetical protein
MAEENDESSRELTSEERLKAALARSKEAQEEWRATQRKAPTEPPPPEKPEQPVLRIPGRLLPEDDPWKIHRKPEIEPDYDATTETQLNALIGECHFYMREVIYRFALQGGESHDRMQYLDRAMRFAETGAKIADSVARLRGGGAVSETRQRLIVERVHTYKGEGEGTESGNQ